MSGVWENELEKWHKFRRILLEHYNIQLYPAGIGASEYTTRGHVRVPGRDYLMVIFEGKTWLNSGDPEVEAAGYILAGMRQDLREGKDPLDLLPCIIIHMTGTFSPSHHAIYAYVVVIY
jgi:hypothetical protein